MKNIIIGVDKEFVSNYGLVVLLGDFMKRKFLQIDLLGDIYMEEIFMFYDEPQLFSCRNNTRHLFVAVLSEYEECAKEWLFVSISDERLLSAKNKGESFYNLFKFPESDNVWCVRKVYGNDNAVATQVKPTDLNDADLPDSDVYMKNNFM